MTNDTARLEQSSTPEQVSEPLHGSDLARHILKETLKAHHEREQAHTEALAIQGALVARASALHKESIRLALDAEQLAIGEVHE